MMSSSEKLCLQWNDFKENIISSFGELRKDREFTDVTLACEDGQQIEAHKVVLASSSPFLMEILKKTKHPHPLVYMRGLKSEDLVAIIDFLYHGETNVLQENLDSFLALAEEFRLKGLTGGAEAEEDPFKETQKINRAPFKPETVQKASVPVSNLEFDVPHSEESYYTTTVAQISDKVNVDHQDLDQQIKSMITKSDTRASNGQGSMASCNVCGKQEALKHMRRHIEAFHIAGVSHPCEICGKVSKTRHGLSMHKSQVHVLHKGKVVEGREWL